MKKILTLILFSALVFPALSQAQTAYTSKGVKVYEGDVRLSVPSVRDIFRGTPAYDVYVRGIRNNRIGHGLLWPGVGYSAMGIVFVIMGSRPGNHGVYNMVVSMMGIGSLVIGTPLMVAGIALRVKGKRMVAGAVNMYNHYLDSSAGNHFPELSFGITPGGAGLTFTF